MNCTAASIPNTWALSAGALPLPHPRRLQSQGEILGECRGGAAALRYHHQPLTSQSCRAWPTCLGRGWACKGWASELWFWKSQACASRLPSLVFSSSSPFGDNANILELQRFQGTRGTGTLSPNNNENLF